jgi:TatD DNase family protein
VHKKPPALIDTHCHLEMSRFEADLDEVIARAREAGVQAMVTIGSTLETSAQAIALAEKYEFIYCTVGIHPHDAKDLTPEALKQLQEWTSHEKVVAIGETGLDYHYDHSPRKTQQKVFKDHLALAVEKNLPAVVHSREATEDTLRILRESGIKKGVMHCFSGDIEMAEAAMGMGLYISIAGPVTFKKAGNLKKVATTVPDEYLLVETDAPYLAPVPMRGKRNEPAYVVHIAAEIARLRDVTLEDVARITTLNAKRLLSLPGIAGAGAVAYKIRDSLYLNITNRCTNKCSFCIRFHSDFVKGHRLRLAEEPGAEEIKAAIGNPKDYKEVVFCGYGEPFLRLDAVKDVASWVKANGGHVRVNTNGHGNLIHGRNILPELVGIVDTVSVSLDAHDARTYEKLCAPSFPNAFEEILSFIKEAKKHIPEVQATVVEMEGVDIEKCKGLAKELSIKLRVRKLHVVG